MRLAFVLLVQLVLLILQPQGIGAFLAGPLAAVQTPAARVLRDARSAGVAGGKGLGGRAGEEGSRSSLDTALSMAWRRGEIRMPSTEPAVPYQKDGSRYPQWMGLTQSLQMERIIIINRYIDNQYANQLIAMLLYLETTDDCRNTVQLYFNCPGANPRAAMSLFDVMQHVPYDICTVNVGLATGLVSFLIAAGTRGQRIALPNARFLMQKQGMDDPYQGQCTDIALEVANVVRINEEMVKRLQVITGQPEHKVADDLQRDFYLSSAEAVSYGVVDKVALPRPKNWKGEKMPHITSGESYGAFEGASVQKYGDAKSIGEWGDYTKPRTENEPLWDDDDDDDDDEEEHDRLIDGED